MAPLNPPAWASWVDRYEEDHRHPVNRRCHAVGIPLIAVSIAAAVVAPLLPWLWWFAAAGFVLGWVAQFIGHHYEGRPPSLLRDPRFLLVGLGWWMTRLVPELLRRLRARESVPAAVADRVRAAQVDLLYRLTPTSLVFSLVAATLVCWLLVGSRPLALLSGWWCLMLIVNVVRLLLMRAYRLAQVSTLQPSLWARRFIIGAFAGGSLWGFCSVVLLPRDQSDVEFALLAILGVIPGIAFSSMSALRRAYMAFVAPFLTPAAVSLLLTGKGSEFIIGVAVVVFICVTWIISTRGERDVVTALGQRFSNEDLIREREIVSVQLREAKDAAERANHAKSLFLANMSHEIRTPMNGVMGMTELLRRTQLSPTQQRYVDVAQQSGQALLTIINDLLDFSKIEAGKVEIERIPFSPREIAGNARDLFAESAAKKNLVFECIVEPSVPALLEGDPTRLRQIVVNLVSNAVKFTERGKVSFCLRRAPGTSDGICSLEITVCDTGIGISSQAIATLFSSFTQADNSTTRRFGGTGLGLAITRQLVELMGGRVDVDSQEGAGAAFTVRVDLPIAMAPTATESGEPALPRLPAQCTVLVAEDNPVNTLLAEAMLQELGCHVLTAENGEKALAALQANDVHLVLMDCQMPVMDGFEATAHLRIQEQKSGARARLPIVALTANAVEGDRERCIQAGMDDYLAKPFSQVQLHAVLARWLAC